MNIPNIDFFDKLITFLGLTIIIISGIFIFTEYKSIKQAGIEHNENLFRLKSSHEDLKKELTKYTDDLQNSVEKLEKLIAERNKINSKELADKFNILTEEDTIRKLQYKSNISEAEKKLTV